MAPRPGAPAPLVYARVTGVLYLLLIAVAPFSMLYVPSAIMVPGDAAATAGNLAASQTLFRLGLAADALVVMVEMVIPALLYVLLRPVSRPLALVATFSRVAMAAVLAVNLLNHVFALQLTSGAGYLGALGQGQVNALVMLFLQAHQGGILVSQVFFGLHIAALGWLVYRSGFFPRVLGVLLMVAALGYLPEAFAYLLAPAWEAVAYPGLAVAVVAEVGFMLWLLIRGLNVRAWERRNAPGFGW